MVSGNGVERDHLSGVGVGRRVHSPIACTRASSAMRRIEHPPARERARDSSSRVSGSGRERLQDARSAAVVELEDRGARHQIDERLARRFEAMMLAGDPCASLRHLRSRTSHVERNGHEQMRAGAQRLGGRCIGARQLGDHPHVADVVAVAACASDSGRRRSA